MADKAETLDDWLAPPAKATAGEPPAATVSPGTKTESLDDWLAPPPHPTATPVTPPAPPLALPPPAVPPPGPVAQPIYTAPTVPLIRPGPPTDQTMPAPYVGAPAPVGITSAQASAGPGIIHGARAAANPLMETGGDVANWLVTHPGIGPEAFVGAGDIQRARDAAEQAQFQQQYGNDPAATGFARATQVAAPLIAGAVVGPVAGAAIRRAGAPGIADFITGAAGQDAGGWAGFGTRLASGATSGAIQGGVTGGAPGAATGAVLGSTVLPILGKAAGWAGARWGDTAAPAIQKIYRAVVQDGMTPGQLESAVSELGPLGTVADVGGSNVKQLAQAVANSPGPGSQAASQYLGTRAEGQTQRLDDAVKTATGATGSAFDTMEQLSNARRAAAAPAYDNFNNNTTVTPEQVAKLRPFIADPIGQQALQKGVNIARMESVAKGEPFNPGDYGVTQADDGTVALLSPTSATPRMLDAVKRGYDQVLEQYRDPTTGRLVLDQTGNAINNMRASFVQQMRDEFPAYGKALDSWAGPSQDMDAISMGRRALTADPDVTASAVSNLSDSQKQMYQVGMAQAMKDKIASTPDDADATRRLFGNDLIRSRIAAGFGGENTPAFQKFQNTVNNEATFAQTKRELLGGSQTAMRTAAIQDMNQPGPDLLAPATHLLMGNPAAAGVNLARQAVSPFVNMLTRPSAQTNQFLGNLLFNPAAQRQLFQNLTPGQAANLRNQLMGWQGQQGAQELLNRNRLQSP